VITNGIQAVGQNICQEMEGKFDVMKQDMQALQDEVDVKTQTIESLTREIREADKKHTRQINELTGTINDLKGGMETIMKALESIQSSSNSPTHKDAPLLGNTMAKSNKAEVSVATNSSFCSNQIIPKIKPKTVDNAYNTSKCKSKVISRSHVADNADIIPICKVGIISNVLSKNAHTDMPSVMLNVDGQSRPFIVDTGSDVSHITQQPKIPVQPFSQTITTTDGNNITTLGKVNLKCTAGTTIIQHEFIVAPKLTDNILGMDFLNKVDAEIAFSENVVKTSLGILPLLKGPGKNTAKSVNAIQLKIEAKSPSVTANKPGTDWKAVQMTDPVLKQVVGWLYRAQRPPWERINRGSHYLKSLWCHFHSLRII
jgi:hypothetical protein